MSSSESDHEESTDEKYHSDGYIQPVDVGDVDIHIADNRDGKERYDRFGQQIVKGGKGHKLSFADEVGGDSPLEEVLHVTCIKKYNSNTVK
jgi:hypothetical protein